MLEELLRVGFGSSLERPMAKLVSAIVSEERKNALID